MERPPAGLKVVTVERPTGVLGWIELKGLRCMGRHGVLPEERAQERVFLIDLAVQTDVGAAAASDDLEQALDLAGLAETVCGVLSG